VLPNSPLWQRSPPPSGLLRDEPFLSESLLRTEFIRPPVVGKESSPRRVGFWHLAVIFGITVLVSGLTTVMVRLGSLRSLTASASNTGNLTINTRPDGFEVLIDGERRGVTPLSLTLASGSYTMIVRGAGNERMVPLKIVAGAEVSHYFEMKAPEPTARATAPSAAKRKPPSSLAGWLSIAAPFQVEVLERDIVIGTSEQDRLAVPSGRHDIVLSNRTLGYVEPRTIEIAAGKPTAIRIDPPEVAVSINVRPWADVFIDGRSVGQTPIGNLLVPIGSHELMFRHPDLGEQKQTVVVSVSGPNRFAADFSR
jgi:hypothetical protein